MLIASFMVRIFLFFRRAKSAVLNGDFGQAMVRAGDGWEKPNADKKSTKSVKKPLDNDGFWSPDLTMSVRACVRPCVRAFFNASA